MESPAYHIPILAKFGHIPEPQVVYREKNADNDYYVVCYWGTALKSTELVDWIYLPDLQFFKNKEAEFGQLKNAYDIVFKERDDLKGEVSRLKSIIKQLTDRLIAAEKY